MNWINSEGGPLLLLSENHISKWLGVVEHNEEESDYDRACRVDDYVGLVEVDGGYGLVFDDEPLQTTWLEQMAGYSGVFIRWRYAKNEISILREIERVPEFVFRSSEIMFVTNCSKHFLFDAALSGLNLQSNDFLIVTLNPGKYKIQTGLFQPNKETAMILHRFVRFEQ